MSYKYLNILYSYDNNRKGVVICYLTFSQCPIPLLSPWENAIDQRFTGLWFLALVYKFEFLLANTVSKLDEIKVTETGDDDCFPKVTKQDYTKLKACPLADSLI
jgi:hypothetical protein